MTIVHWLVVGGFVVAVVFAAAKQADKLSKVAGWFNRLKQ